VLTLKRQGGSLMVLSVCGHGEKKAPESPRGTWALGPTTFMTLGMRDAEFVQEPVVGLVAPQAGKGCSANQVG